MPAHIQQCLAVERERDKIPDLGEYDKGIVLYSQQSVINQTAHLQRVLSR